MQANYSRCLILPVGSSVNKTPPHTCGKYQWCHVITHSLWDNWFYLYRWSDASETTLSLLALRCDAFWFHCRFFFPFLPLSLCFSLYLSILLWLSLFFRGIVDTPLIHSEDLRPLVQRWLSDIPAGRLAQVTDLQAAVVYLASDVSDYMTGHNLVIEGGQSLW